MQGEFKIIHPMGERNKEPAEICTNRGEVKEVEAVWRWTQSFLWRMSLFFKGSPEHRTDLEREQLTLIYVCLLLTCIPVWYSVTVRSCFEQAVLMTHSWTQQKINDLIKDSYLSHMSVSFIRLRTKTVSSSGTEKSNRLRYVIEVLILIPSVGCSYDTLDVQPSTSDSK